MTGSPPAFSSSALRRQACCLLVMLALCAGCQTLGSRNDPSSGDSVSTKGIVGPLERLLLRDSQQSEVLVNPLLASQGRTEYDEAERLYQAGQYKQAEKILKKIAKKYKNAPVREDALFLIAECQFQRKRYSWAQDSYDRLVKDYPSTRYLDRFSKRQFELARYWLRFPNVVTGDAIQTVNYDQPSKSEPLKIADVPTRDPTRLVPILPNFFDRSRPIFDTDGRALEALKSVWLNDPTGPLADDALMLSASHYLRKQDWTEADRLFTLIREEYPKSPHLEQSFILGSHAKLMSYQGPAYDGKKLAEAKQLKERILKLFPQHPDRERFLDEIRKIEEALARHDWEMVEYYRRKNRPDAMAIYCESIIDRYASTTYSDRARQTLREINEQRKPGRLQLEQPDLQPVPKPAPTSEPPEYEEPPAKVQL